MFIWLEDENMNMQSVMDAVARFLYKHSWIKNIFITVDKSIREGVWVSGKLKHKMYINVHEWNFAIRCLQMLTEDYPKKRVCIIDKRKNNNDFTQKLGACAIKKPRDKKLVNLEPKVENVDISSDQVRNMQHMLKTYVRYRKIPKKVIQNVTEEKTNE